MDGTKSNLDRLKEIGRSFAPESDNIARVLVELLSDGVFKIDSTGRIDYASDTFLQTFGYERDELIGSLVEVLVPDRLKDEHEKWRDDFIRDGKPRRLRSRDPNFPFVGVRRDGCEVRCQLGIAPITWNGERGAIGIVKLEH